MRTRARTAAERALAFAALCLAVCACGCARVEPWERGRLAKPHMALEPCPELRALREHTYLSREGSAAALRAAGGGCGCY
ncbi:MAG: DUF4266 domain-containing protein [Myxococcota bacterium]